MVVYHPEQNKTVLVIVDMQYDFSASSNQRTISEIMRQIDLAKRRKSPIVFLEYKHEGETIEELMDYALEDYEEVYQIEKEDDDGSLELCWGFAEFDLPFTHLRICGINTDACVADTVRGLIRDYPEVKVEVVKKGCHSSNFGSKSAWKQFPHERHNLRILTH